MYVPLAKPCLSDDIRLLLLYSIPIMLNITVRPLHCRMNFYRLHRVDLMLVPSLHERHFYSLGSDAHPEITVQ